MSATVDHTEEELREFITSFSEVLKVSKESIYTEHQTDISSVRVDDVDEETIKLTKLIYAHTTKIGIAFRPPVSINAAYSQLQEISQYFVLLVSLIPLFQQDQKFSKFFISELKTQVSKLLNSYINFLKELCDLKFTEKLDSTNNSVDRRLVSIGITWDLCDGLQKLITGGNVDLLKENIKQSIAIVDDAYEEFGEWLESPEKCDDSNPFGFKDEEEEDEHVQEDETTGSHEMIGPHVLSMATKWHSKVKLIKLLLLSLSKSLPTDETNIVGADLDEFNQNQDHLIGLMDDLVSSFFIWSSTQELEKYASDIIKQSEKLIELVKLLNKGDESKIKWLKIWLERFVEL